MRAENQAAARAWTEELARFWIDATRRPWALATVAYGRALTADQDEAEALFQESLEHHDRAGRPLDAARTQLAYGKYGYGEANAGSTPASTCARRSRPSRTCAPPTWPH